MINLKFIHKKFQSSYKTLINCKSIPNYSNKQISHRYIKYVYELTLMRRLVWDQNKKCSILSQIVRENIAYPWPLFGEEGLTTDFSPNNIIFETKMGTPGKNCRNPQKMGFSKSRMCRPPPLTFYQSLMDDGECGVLYSMEKIIKKFSDLYFSSYHRKLGWWRRKKGH